MQNWVKGSVVASVLLTGCSVFQSEQDVANRSAYNHAELKLPAGLAQPAKPGKFDIPEISSTVISEADTHSPALVLATAGSSRIEEGDRLSRVWFDRNDSTGELVPFLQRILQAQFAEQAIELTADETGLIYTTGWIARSEKEGFWFWQSSQQQEQARFKISIEPRPHGRAASMMVTMLEHQHFNAEAKLEGREAQRQEVALLNQIIDRIGKEEIIVARANKAKAPDVSLEPGIDAEGHPALITQQSIDVTWSQLEALLAELNFAVTDMNRTEFTYYVNYTKPEPGFWSKLWGSSDKVVLPLTNGEYQLVLGRVNKQTAITLRDKDGTYLNTETTLALHEPFVQAIRQARIEL